MVSTVGAVRVIEVHSTDFFTYSNPSGNAGPVQFCISTQFMKNRFVRFKNCNELCLTS